MFVNSDAELLSARILPQRKNRRDFLGFVLPISVNIAQYIFLFIFVRYSNYANYDILASAMWKFSVELTQTALSPAEWFRDGQFSMAHYIREVLNSVSQADAVLRALKKDYRVYAPKRFPKQGRYSDTDIIRYAEVDSFADIVWDTKSDYPAKEVITPIQQAIFYFTEDEYRASKAKTKPILLLARPCDINAQRIQARIYAGNGGYDDLYYTRVRELVKFAVMDCNGGDDTCFCVSMGTNRTDDYALALKFSYDGLLVEVADESLLPYFQDMPQADYTHTFEEENELKVTIPDLSDKAVRKARFGEEHMCVGCGRCTHRCPELISISATVNKMSAAVEEIKASMASQ